MEHVTSATWAGVPAAHVIELDPDRSVLGVLEAAGHSRPLVALAGALAASPPARTLEGVVLAVRERPRPILVFAGPVDRAGRVRLEELQGLLHDAATRLRLIGWPEVERLCARLAERLLERLGPDLIGRCSLVGVPRGGLIVAGLLAYTLGIPRTQVGEDTSASTVIIVDDCAISGVRLREVLAASPAERIVVATLLSAPGLRATVEDEPRVVAAVSADDLRDHGRAMLGEGYGSWRQRWTERVPGRYHTALLDLVAFPWSEPDVRLDNEATGRIEPHWWLAPPSSCISHRSPAAELEVQVAEDTMNDARLLAPTVVPVRRDGTIALIDTSGGASIMLRDVGAELWDAWSETADLGSAAARIARRYQEPADRVHRDLERLLDRLRERGLLASRASVPRSRPGADV